MGFEIKPHTLILMIGPSGCGKTTFCKKTLIPFLLENFVIEFKDVSYVSSDECREELLNFPETVEVDKYGQKMLASSAQAFELLYSKIEAHMRFPLASKYIIVDTKGTFEPFRNDMLKLAEKHHYNICAFVFNYKKYDDFTDHWKDKEIPVKVKKSIINDIKKMRLEIYKDLKRKNIPWYSISTRKDLERESIAANINFKRARLNIIPNDAEFLIISDIHGCWDELQELLLKANITINPETKKIKKNEYNKYIILAGDLIDKGPKSKEVLEFVWANIMDYKFYVISGNHDHHLYKDIMNGEPTQTKWYDTYEKLTAVERNKYIENYTYYHPFLYNDYMIITHAPCHPKFLGKEDPISKQMQSYIKVPWEDHAAMMNMENFAEWLDPVIELNSYNICTTHYFGHIMVSTPGNVVNGRCAIDGGCAFANGGKLIGISVCKDFKPHILSVHSKQNRMEGVFKKFPAFKRIITEETYKPTAKEFGRMKWVMRHKVNFISGTMTPCDKDNGALETVASALKFYVENGVKAVVMQPKYMGSRCNAYIFMHDTTSSYFVSRGGYLINDMKNSITGKPFEFSPIIDKLVDIARRIFTRDENDFDFADIKMILFDGELLPWAALGAGLINEFNQVYYSAKEENKFLAETGFEELKVDLDKTYNESEFIKDSSNIPKKELVEKYGNAKYECYSALKTAPFVIPVEEKNEMLETYKGQVNLYGSTDRPLEFRPFAILKIVLKDGTEIVPHVDGLKGKDNHTLFDEMNSDMEIKSRLIKFTLDNPDVLSQEFMAAQQWFDKLAYDLGYEGVVIKPLQFNQRVLPYMKVRNKKYLTIVYGYDYTNDQKYKKLYDRKGIGSKMRLSKKEWILGLKMLKTPYDSIDEKNKDYFKLLTEFIVEEKSEQKLDPRL